MTFANMKPILIAGLLLCTLFPGAVRAGSYTSYGPIYASYRMSPAKGGGCISGTVGNGVPGSRNKVAVVFVSEENADSTLKQGAFGYVRERVRKDILPGVSTFTMCLRPGRYRIIGIATGSSYSANRVAIPFEVQAGKDAYLGSFVLEGYGLNPDCQRSALGPYVNVRDEFDRDAPSIRSAKDSSGLPFEEHMIVASKGHPYFVTCSRPGA